MYTDMRRFRAKTPLGWKQVLEVVQLNAPLTRVKKPSAHTGDRYTRARIQINGDPKWKPSSHRNFAMKFAPYMYAL